MNALPCVWLGFAMAAAAVRAQDRIDPGQLQEAKPLLMAVTPVAKVMALLPSRNVPFWPNG